MGANLRVPAHRDGDQDLGARLNIDMPFDLGNAAAARSNRNLLK
jgi:hypothetical protein